MLILEPQSMHFYSLYCGGLNLMEAAGGQSPSITISWKVADSWVCIVAQCLSVYISLSNSCLWNLPVIWHFKFKICFKTPKNYKAIKTQKWLPLIQIKTQLMYSLEIFWNAQFAWKQSNVFLFTNAPTDMWFVRIALRN